MNLDYKTKKYRVIDNILNSRPHEPHPSPLTILNYGSVVCHPTKHDGSLDQNSE